MRRRPNCASRTVDPMTSPQHLIRDEIRALAAYHVPAAGRFIKLDAMESPYSLPAGLQAGLAEVLAHTPLNRYPDAQGAELKAALRSAMGIADELDVLMGNGSDEIIQIIAAAVAKPGAALLSVEPAFVMFRMIATFCRLQYVGVPLRADFELDEDALLAAMEVHRPAVTFIAYPNNPTGNLFAADAIERIIRACPGLVVIDEAYFAFAKDSFLDRIAGYPNAVLMRTVSKLGLAGLRLGLLIGRSEWLQEFEKVRLPYNINVLTQAAARFALEHYEVLKHQARAIVAARDELARSLGRIPGVALFPSQANFVLIRVPEARRAFDGLLSRGILVKDVSRSHPLLTNCLRITVGTPEENAAFAAALTASI
jgi:histidinol-phosphate aminotransferase